MPAATVYRHYDQAALDDQYNNRAKVPDFDAIVRNWAERSAAFRGRTRAILDLAYGGAERETLDLFPAPSHGAPLHVFFHGGYWQAMDKALFHFVGETPHALGAHVAFVNYPLAPKASLDAVVSACRRSIAWLWAKGREIVGDISGIYVSGHSAGGHLVGMLMATDWSAFGPATAQPVLLGGCSLSGLFDLEPIRLSYLNAVLGLDQDTALRNSPLHLDPFCRGPLILVTGALESDEYQRQSQSLRDRWQVLGVDVSHHVVPVADHFTILESLVDPASPVMASSLSAMQLLAAREML